MTTLLEGFETWLRRQPALPSGPPTSSDGPDLGTLLREFIALRQEINLLTRATRTQQEQNAATLATLQASVENQSQASEDPGVDDSRSPDTVNLKQLMEVRDALSRAEREMGKARTNLDPVLAEALPVEPEEPPLPKPPPMPTASSWGRWFGGSAPDLHAWQEYIRAIEARQALRRQRVEAATRARQAALDRVRQIVGSLLDGYAMSVQRIDRLLEAHDLEAIETEGQRFDPELMEALEVVPGTGRPAGEVIEELRRGYRQGDRVIRFALVRVARDN